MVGVVRRDVEKKMAAPRGHDLGGWCGGGTLFGDGVFGMGCGSAFDGVGEGALRAMGHYTAV